MLNVTLNKFKVNNRNTRMMPTIFYPNFNKKSVANTCSKLRKKQQQQQQQSNLLLF